MKNRGKDGTKRRPLQYTEREGDKYEAFAHLDTMWLVQIVILPKAQVAGYTETRTHP